MNNSNMRNPGAAPRLPGPEHPAARESAGRPALALLAGRTNGAKPVNSFWRFLVAIPAPIQGMLRCPVCRGRLAAQNGVLDCTNRNCGQQFPVVDGVPVLVNEQNSVFTCADFVSRHNTTFNLSRSRWISEMDRWLPTLGQNLPARQNYRVFAESLLKLSSHPTVLIVGGAIWGCGMEELASKPQIQMVETDVSFGMRTQVICDAHDLPFADNTFDGVVAQAVLQYVVEPSRCVREIRRVLKPGGLVYAETAFMQQVVHGRYDFTRFTHLGFLRLFRGFEEVGSGAVSGPGMALAWSCQFFLLSLTTTRWARRAIYGFARLTLFWLKYLDLLLMNNPGTYDAASGFYFLGRKNGQVRSDRELVALYRGAQ